MPASARAHQFKTRLCCQACHAGLMLRCTAKSCLLLQNSASCHSLSVQCIHASMVSWQDVCLLVVKAVLCAASPAMSPDKTLAHHQPAHTDSYECPIPHLVTACITPHHKGWSRHDFWMISCFATCRSFHMVTPILCAALFPQHPDCEHAVCDDPLGDPDGGAVCSGDSGGCSYPARPAVTAAVHECAVPHVLGALARLRGRQGGWVGCATCMGSNNTAPHLRQLWAGACLPEIARHPPCSVPAMARQLQTISNAGAAVSLWWLLVTFDVLDFSSAWHNGQCSQWG